MRASINQTGRTQIPSDQLSIEMIDKSKLKFTWNFKNIAEIDGTEAILELNSIGKIERISLPINEITSFGERVITLGKNIETKGITGRFKIVKTTDDGLRFILKESKTLRLENDKLEGENGKSLLDVFNDPQLRIPWQLIFDDGEPVLKVSDYHENAPKIYTHTIFQTSILPEIVRQISFWLLTEDPDESQNSKIPLWWIFLENLGLTSEDRAHFTGIINKDIEVINEVMIKCQELADQFAVQHKILEKLTNFLAEDDN
jgi:hypothetical protein